VADPCELVLSCGDLDDALAMFVRLGFRLDTIYPADDPAVALISGHGERIRLERGTGIELPRELPPLQPAFVIARDDASAWRTGRAGMKYRDLIPDRQGGRFIASHIRIVDGGPVPDYVHFHDIRFQMIYCRTGWVRLVYEDQGEPFTMHAGDCVVQPPRIRHRVLEASAGLEVIEVGCPAIHATHADHELALPTVVRDRSYDGQRFVWHRARAATWIDGACDLGIAAATGGVASARVLRRGESRDHDRELLFGCVLHGQAKLRGHELASGDAFTVPAGRFELAGSPDLEWLEVEIPGKVPE
jgi:quercetin dioxygenase-like cupin family protein